MPGFLLLRLVLLAEILKKNWHFQITGLIDPCAQRVYEVDKVHRPMCAKGNIICSIHYVLPMGINLLFSGPAGNCGMVSNC